MTEIGPAPAVFDLSSISDSFYRAGSRTLRNIFAAVLVLVNGVAVWLVAATAGVLSDPFSFGESLFIVVGFGSVAVFGITSLSPGAVRAEVTRAGLTLGYRNGRTREYQWDAPSTRLTLWLSRPTTSNIPSHEIRTRFPSDNPLTPEAFDAILSSARIAGLEILTTEQSGRPPRTVFRIRGKAPS